MLPPADVLPDVMFSMNALRRAWQQVRRSGGTPGTDGITLAAFEARLDVELNRLRQAILDGVYQPHPVRRYYVRKASGKQRPISIWSFRDRVAQRVIHDYLTPHLEMMFLACSYGYRPGRSTADAVKAVVAARDAGLVWVLDADIIDCFGSIPPDALMAQVERIIPTTVAVSLIERWLYAPVAGQSDTIAGVSQGGVISPQLANLYLHRFDEMLTAVLARARLVRFADDFIILNRTEDETVWSLEVARRSLANLRLSLNMRKTRLLHFDEGFTFVGAHFQGKQVSFKESES